jgi:hypothetical protein
MNQRELERLEKDSVYTMKVSSDLKDQVINGYLNELNKVIKTNVKKKELVVIVFDDKTIS